MSIGNYFLTMIDNVISRSVWGLQAPVLYVSRLAAQAITVPAVGISQDGEPIMRKILVKRSKAGENVRELTEEPLTPKAAILCNPRMDAYILSIVGLSKQVDVPALKKALKSILVKYKPFSSTVKKGKWGNYMWVHEEDIDIDKHVIVPNLGPQYTQCKDFVEDYTASLANDQQLDPSRPPWQVHVLNYKSGEAESNLVFKIHHCIGDCVSLMSLLLEYTRKATDSNSMPTVQNADRRVKRIPFNWRRLNFFQTLWSLIFVFWLTVKDLFNLVATILCMKDSNIFRGRKPSCPRHLAHVTIDLQDIVAVKNTVNCTVNDVVVGMLSAGFVRYINHHQVWFNGLTSFSPQLLNSMTNDFSGLTESILKDCNVEKVVSKLRLRALVAVNMRSKPGLHRLEYMLNNPKQASWGNEFGTWLLPVPLNKQEDHLDYCRLAKANLLKKKASMEAPMMFSLLGLVSQLYGVQLAMYLLYRVTLNTTMVFSNMLGPLEEVQLLGNPVTHIVSTVSWLPQPLVVHFQSYASKAKLAVMATEDIMPDPLQFCMDCADALKQMKEAALKS